MLEGGHHEFGETETIRDILRRQTQSLQQHSDGLTTFTVDADANGVSLVDVELQPCTAGRDDLDGVQRTLGRLVDGLVEVDARRANQLRHDDTLGTVDDERAFIRHHWEIANEDGLAFNFARHGVGKFRRHIERGGVVNVLILGFIDRVLDVVEAGLG